MDDIKLNGWCEHGRPADGTCPNCHPEIRKNPSDCFPGLLILPDLLERSWQKDFPLENGNYMCQCTSCKKNFIGHKRRITCSICASDRGVK
jgi:hypothetical protein